MRSDNKVENTDEVLSGSKDKSSFHKTERFVKNLIEY